MPIVITEGKTPKGTRCMRAQVSGKIGLAEAKSMGDLMLPGASYHQQLAFCIVEKGTEYSPEARAHFRTLQGNFSRMAAVVTSPVVRAAINFIARLMDNKPTFRMFTDEAEAMVWLDAYVPPA